METFKFNPRIVRDLRKYNKEKFAADTMAGLIVGIVALPLAIAFAIAASPGGDANHTIGPVAGILTAIVAGFIISALGGSRVQIGGPTGAFIVIIYGVVAQFGLTGLMLATIMAGVFLVLLGVFRLGTIIKFIPYPIVVGVTSGIAVTIFTLFVVSFAAIWKWYDPVLPVLGSYSLYFYLTHTFLFMWAVNNGNIHEEMKVRILYAAVIIAVVSIVLGIVMDMMLKPLQNLLKKKD